MRAASLALIAKCKMQRVGRGVESAPGVSAALQKSRIKSVERAEYFTWLEGHGTRRIVCERAREREGYICASGPPPHPSRAQLLIQKTFADHFHNR